MLKIFNTLSRKVEEFKSIQKGKVGMYTCGPTVYDYTHIGHLRKYINDDILKKTLRANGYDVHHVMNITDVGHLTSDSDTGEDKMEKGASETGRTVWEVAKFFEDYFFKSVNTVNIERADIVCRATEHIGKQVKLIEALEKNGLTYTTSHAVYFDVTKFPKYGQLSGQKLEDKEVGSRSDVFVDKSKKHPADFALWFFTVGHFKDHTMKWSSPWGEGFPGWHIECSAMSMEYLGDSFDVHTGGIDHIPVHHENEIAQAEGATGKQFVKYWVHHDFVNIDKEKMSKSKKNFLRVEEIEGKGYDPMALRYLYLTAHYRSEISFSFDSLDSAQAALNRLRNAIKLWNTNKVSDVLSNKTVVTQGGFLSIDRNYNGDLSDTQKMFKESIRKEFYEYINNDLNVPQSLSVLWKLIGNNPLPAEDKNDLVREMDKVLGLDLEKYMEEKVPSNIQNLADKRYSARKLGDYSKADEYRDELDKLGYVTTDTAHGTAVYKKNNS